MCKIESKDKCNEKICCPTNKIIEQWYYKASDGEYLLEIRWDFPYHWKVVNKQTSDDYIIDINCEYKYEKDYLDYCIIGIGEVYKQYLYCLKWTKNGDICLIHNGWCEDNPACDDDYKHATFEEIYFTN